MTKKAKSDQKIKELCGDITREAATWMGTRDHGCNDPFWPDGCNMNLTRNHIISYKRQIQELCEENGMSLPEEYYIPTPPEVDDDYMAGLRQKDRVQRLKQQGCEFNRKAPEYDPGQMSLMDFMEAP